MAVQDIVKGLLPLLNLRQDEIVFLAGSHAVGWATDSSDIDVYVLGEPPADLRANSALALPQLGDRVKVLYLSHRERNVEFQFWPLEDVLAFDRTLREHPLNPLTELWHKQVELFHRIRTALAVQNAAALEQLRSKIDWTSLERYLATFHLRVHESYYYDSLSAIEEGRLVDAALMARLSLDHAVDASLAVKHETNMQPKWRYRKLTKALGESNPVTQRWLRTLEVPLSRSDDEVVAHVSETLYLAELLSASTLMSWDIASLIPTSAVELGPQRALASKLRREVNSIGLIGLDGTLFEVNSAAALIWTLADGKLNRHSISGVLGRHYGIGRRRANEVVSTFLEQLLQQGLLLKG